ncbi:MAG: hydantoinase/carbamoylase family amidase [Proteobacteria bacterium]|nr:hydantoinase/carbamoylase family amidase [Pseudomonadota bacterium]MDA0982422.1 hydantoinase/carbamoylase family amidase [Pseudomonadota bacterium]
MARINAERLLSDLRHLRSIGAQGRGVVRPAFSPKDMEARRWLKQRYEEARLEASIDGVGNVYGRSRQPGKALLSGSHSDTQPTGGWLDGALGVVYALEVVRALSEDAATKSLPVDAVSFQDEESRFLGCLGSRSITGALSPDMEQGATDSGGVALEAALRDAGLAGVPRLRLDPARYCGFVEAHIEQGPTLEDTAHRIGVVSGIVGLRGIRFEFRGQQNHAGTTMMKTRRDASTALYELAHRINQAFPTVAAERTVWTMGRVRVEPNATSIVPGYADMDLQFRDLSEVPLKAFEAVVERLVAEMNARGGVKITATPSRAPIAPTQMDPGLRAHLEAAAERHAPGKWQRLPSGAFHDAGIISAVLPSAMLFIPSIGGISHDFTEDSRDGDIVLGCQVLADAAAAILAEANAS